MFNVRLLALAPLLMLTDCAPPSDYYHVRLDPSCDLDIAMAAIDEWEEKAHVRLFVEITPYGCNNEQDCIFIQETTDTYFNGIVDTCKEAHGWGCTLRMPDTNTSHTKIRIDLDKKAKNYAYLHELGHGFSLVHYGPGAIMFPEYHGYDVDVDHIMPIDVWQYNKLRGR